MKPTISVLFGLLITTSIAAAESAKIYECTPELGAGKEIIGLSLNLNTKKASLSVNEVVVKNCQNVSFAGELIEYGESELLISCQGGTITLRQDYDETSLDVKILDLKLSDTTYMCDQSLESK